MDLKEFVNLIITAFNFYFNYLSKQKQADQGNLSNTVKIVDKRVEIIETYLQNTAGWSEWGEWGLCVDGIQSRKRMCNNPPPFENGNYCEGDNVNSRACGCQSFTITNGIVTLVSDTPLKIVKVVCNNSYLLRGSATLTCKGSKWDSELPTCDLLDCGKVTIENGIVSTNIGTTLSNTAIITCNVGYTLIGDSKLTCTANGWGKYIPSCAIIDCGDPTPLFGKSSSLITKYRSETTISCDHGYILSGAASIKCRAGGTWSDTPMCVPKDCGQFTVENGVVSTNSGTTFTNTAIITCNVGYTLIGDTKLTCTANGWDRVIPTCDVIDCGDPTPLFGKSSSSTTTYQSDTTISCDHGYLLSGADTITCQAGGTWSDTPSCVPKDCGKFTVENGIVSTNSGTTLSNTAITTCNVGYTLIGDTKLTCTANGWDRDIPTCDIIDCGDPTPLFGKSSSPTTKYQSDTTISCDHGYLLSGAATITCQAGGTWSDTPSCVPKDCGKFTVENGVVSTNSGTTLSNKAIITCNVGFSLYSQLTCTADGWGGYIPTCKIQE